jgi:hypothetical protein
MRSQGDPRVLFVMNAALSGLFSVVVVSGLDFLGVVAFSWPRVALATSVLMLLTWIAILR